jgi:hypothetical protein
MSARLVGQLAARGIRLRRVGDQLGVRFPDRIEPPGAVTFLREHKAELLATLTPPTFPRWPPSALAAAVSARVAVLRGWGYSGVAAELQAAEEALGVSDPTPYRCELHNCFQRKLPGSDLYRCPACLAGAFAQRSAG